MVLDGLRRNCIDSLFYLLFVKTKEEEEEEEEKENVINGFKNFVVSFLKKDGRELLIQKLILEIEKVKKQTNKERKK